MSSKLSTLESAENILASSYALSSCGIGVQRQLVNYLVDNPPMILEEDCLVETLDTGYTSNMLTAKVILEEAFEKSIYLAINRRVDELREAWKKLESGLWKVLAYGSDFNDTDDSSSDFEELKKMFENLVGKGYFSEIPPENIMLHFLSEGADMKFGLELSKVNIEFDYDKLKTESHKQMLGKGRKDYTGFHAGKLILMADVANEALLVRKNETEEPDYIPEASGRWRELFNEDKPPITQLIKSAHESAKMAMIKTGQ